MDLVIESDGTVRCLYDEAVDLTTLGHVRIDRGSHVEPDDQGRWFLDLSPVDGPLLGPFAKRGDALTVEFDDESVADFFDRQVDAGLKPEQFARIWIHTHPGDSAWPSSTDEETFARVFGGSEWALMFILAEEGETYARLQCNVGPGVSQELAVEIDYSQPFAGTDWDTWEAEYLTNVREQVWSRSMWPEETLTAPGETTPSGWRDAWHDYSDDEFQEAMAYE